MASVAPLIVITGPTASGKSALALELAEKWGGEIVCADSRTVYKGMDIGTAKPSETEQIRVRHWLLDVVEPGKRFTVVDFQKLAKEAISDIRSRGKIPFLVGGTGLYIDAVVLNFVFGPEVDLSYREELQSKSKEELLALIKKQRIQPPENIHNKRYLIRSIEKNNTSTSKKIQPDSTTTVVALLTEKEELRKRIRARVEAMFTNNIVQEAQRLFEQYGENNEALTGNIYRIVRQMIRGDIDGATAKAMSATRDWQLAKRQITWLKRHDYVEWLSYPQAYARIETILRKYRDD